jgi:hypothetical protein
VTININVVIDLFWFTSITSVVLLLYGAVFLRSTILHLLRAR